MISVKKYTHIIFDSNFKKRKMNRKIKLLTFIAIILLSTSILEAQIATEEIVSEVFKTAKKLP